MLGIKGLYYKKGRNIYFASSLSSRIKAAFHKLYWKANSAFRLGFIQTLKYGTFCLATRFSGKGKPTPKREKKDIVLLSLPRHGTEFPPAGIAYLKSYLTKQGYSCKCLDFNIRLYDRTSNKGILNPRDRTVFIDEASFRKFCQEEGYNSVMDDWAQEILSFQPRFIAFSATSYVTLWTMRHMAEKLREKRPEVPIIVGGSTTKDFKERLITEYGSDIVILGSGEKTLKKVLDALDSNAGLKGIKGIIYRKDKNIITQEGEEEPETLDNLPFPDYDDFDLTQYSEKSLLSNRCSLMVQAARGCTRNCTFCTYKFYANSFEQKDVERTLKEILFLKEKYGVSTFNFSDAMLNANVGFMESFCDLVVKSKESFFWSCQFGFKEDIPPSLISKMAKAGCCSLLIGLESGSEKVRKEMLKSCSKGKVENLFKEIHKAKIPTTVNLIVGYPTETEEDFNQTISLLNTMYPYIGQTRINPCHILPGSLLFRQAARDTDFTQDDDNYAEWTYKDNTPQERVKRMDKIIAVAQEYGLIRKSNTYT